MTEYPYTTNRLKQNENVENGGQNSILPLAAS
eukprot:COSAG01_NODE_72446_length_253_cov_0.558442_1_plen_31_part_10